MTIGEAIQPPSARTRNESGLHRVWWLSAARAAFVLLTLVTVGVCVSLVPTALAHYSSVCTLAPADQCPDGQVTPAGARALQALGITLRAYSAITVGTIAFAALVYLFVAVLIFWRRSNDWMGLFTATFLVSFGLGANGFISTLTVPQPWMSPIVSTIVAIGNVAIVVFFLIFPNGRFVPRWTIVVPVFWLIQVPGIFNNAAQLPSWLSGPLFVAVLLVICGAAMYRYRRVSSPLERQQTKWAVLGGVLLVAVDVGVSLGLLAVEAMSGTAYSVLDVFSNTLYILAPVSIPISIGLAILRYRLFDIDVFIRRTMIYATLTAVLAGLYFGVVLTAQLIAERLTHQAQPPAWLIVVTTLAIATLFTPLRHRIQRTIDQRFYRSRYDATRTVEAFAATLRTEVDLTQLSAHLVGVVDETMRPARISLWLAHSTSGGLHGRTPTEP